MLKRPQTLEILRPSTPTDGTPSAKIFGLSDCGPHRGNNEDQFLVAHLERALCIAQCGVDGASGLRVEDQSATHFLAVADGMGGHASGEVASQVVLDSIARFALEMAPFWSRGTDGAISPEILARAAREAQARLFAVAERKGLGHDLGTTLTLACVTFPDAWIVHVGDSRAYLQRGESLKQLTSDHNLANEMVRKNVLTEEQARVSRYSNVLTNAVGGGEEELDVDVFHVSLERGDKLFLCTDGLHGVVPDDAISTRLSFVTGGHLVEPSLRSLVKLALDKGSRDNVTGVLGYF